MVDSEVHAHTFQADECLQSLNFGPVNFFLVSGKIIFHKFKSARSPVAPLVDRLTGDRRDASLRLNSQCVVSLSKTLSATFSTGSTQEDRKFSGC